MAIVLAAGSKTGSISQLITVLLIFILVLAITALTTRFIGGYQKMQGRNRNLEVIETVRVANNKYVQIVRTADKYIVIGIGKNEVSMLTEIDEDALVNISGANSSGTGSTGCTSITESFSDVIGKAKAAFTKKDIDNSSEDDDSTTV